MAPESVRNQQSEDEEDKGESEMAKKLTNIPKGLSIHIGVNRVDPRHYDGWDGALSACEFDANDMAKLARSRGFSVGAKLLTRAATSHAVIAALEQAAKDLKKGDMLFLTYSGHGGQVTDLNGDEKANDRKDETWVLFDRQLVDDELYELYGKFRSGVRIVVLSDSCHSGTVTRSIPPMLEGGPRVRAMPSTLGQQVERANSSLYRGIQKAHVGAERAKIAASVLLISGCMDNQLSLDGDHNGLFTGTFKAVWKARKFRSYRGLRDRIVAAMPDTQTPNYYVVGKPEAAFEAQFPLTI
jgi:hypothetical protein